MMNILGNEKLNELPTKINYYYYENELGDCNGVSFYHDTKKRLIEFGGLQEVSDKIMKAICYVYKNSLIQTIDQNTCEFLYYWISYMLLKHLTSSSSYNTVISFLYAVLRKNGRDKICDILHWNMDFGKRFEDIKLMFDYSKDYSIYKKQLTETNPQCYNDYMIYLEKYVKTYKKLKNECKGENLAKKHCELFMEYVNNNDYNDLSTLKCDLKESETRPEQLLRGQVDVEDHKELNVTRGGTEETATGYQDLSHTSSSTDISEMDSTETNGKDTPTSIASPTVIGMTTIAGIVVPSYLAYNVISIVIKKLNVILYI
ncbi:hypothetical protein PVIIG_05579 [Plasmodium vivax India VII]|uniref:Variable surface protein Vir7-like protein n=1 Tax=Plasmodium vivax India VII TaxID=1077284 RepID=A0A0J9SLV7_PLAVI|nr:hypothetical protein PVIIG_05579 [Plasmodium vivax India VII]